VRLGRHLDAHTDEAHMQRILDVEFGGMQESLYNWPT
jgi:hypothetical protein